MSARKTGIAEAVVVLLGIVAVIIIVAIGLQPVGANGSEPSPYMTPHYLCPDFDTHGLVEGCR